MNFFGHAAVATWRSSTPAFVLGAMLPDFSSMIRARPPRTRHADLRAGIEFHHRTDHAFHESPTFRRLSAEAFEVLLARGLRRGSSRAVAHIGVELLLDFELAEDPASRAAFRAAIVAARADQLAQHLEWAEAVAAPRFLDLCARIEARGSAEHAGGAEILARRIHYSLAGRPRLELDAGGIERVIEWGRAFETRVRADAETMIAEVRRALDR